MKNESHLNQRQQEEFVHAAKTEHTPLVFDSPEQLLRADRMATSLPPDITHRIASSLAAEPRPPVAPWWKRWLGL